MADSLSSPEPLVSLRPGRPERPLLLAAEPVMNAQALLDDIRQFNARQARIERVAAAERDRYSAAISAVLIALCESIAKGERKRAST